MPSKITLDASEQSAFVLDLSCLKLFDVKVSHTFKDDSKEISTLTQEVSNIYIYTRGFIYMNKDCKKKFATQKDPHGYNKIVPYSHKIK